MWLIAHSSIVLSFHFNRRHFYALDLCLCLGYPVNIYVGYSVSGQFTIGRISNYEYIYIPSFSIIGSLPSAISPNKQVNRERKFGFWTKLNFAPSKFVTKKEKHLKPFWKRCQCFTCLLVLGKPWFISDIISSIKVESQLNTTSAQDTCWGHFLGHCWKSRKIYIGGWIISYNHFEHPPSASWDVKFSEYSCRFENNSAPSVLRVFGLLQRQQTWSFEPDCDWR